MATADSIEEASDKAGIHRNSAYRYLKDDNFKEARKKLRRGTMDVVSGRVQHEALESINVLASIRDNEEVSPHTRVQASKEILDKAYKSFEMDDMIDRIEKLEDMLND